MPQRKKDPHLHAGSVFRRLWEGWKRVGKRVADVQSRLLLSIFYFAVLAPFALAEGLAAATA